MRSLRTLLFLIAVAGLSLLATALVLRLPGAAALLSNADALYLPALFDDLRGGLGALAGWHLTPGPYAFPDMLVYGLADLLASGFRQAIGLNAALQLGLFLLLGAAVHRVAGGRAPGLAVGALAVILAALFAFGLGVAGPYALNWLVYPVLTTFHFGAILVAAAALALLLRRIDRPGPWPLLGLAVLIPAGVLSDSFVLPYAAAPALALVLAMLPDPRARRAAAAGVVVGGAALAAFLLQDVVNPLNAVYRRQLDVGIGYGLSRLGGVLWPDAGAERAVNLGLIAFALLPVARAAVVLAQMATGQRQLPDAADRIAIFVAASSLATLAAVVLFGIFRDASFLRYFQPWLFLTAIWLGHLAATRLRRPAWPVGAALALMLAAGAVAWARPARLALAIEVSPALACFDGPDAGLAGYWLAKPLVLQSGGRVQVAQVARNGAPYHWIVNEDWARRDRAGGSGAPAFSFILMDGLNARAVIARYGTPDRVDHCAGIPLWRYDDPDRLRRPLARAVPVTLPD